MISPKTFLILLSILLSNLFFSPAMAVNHPSVQIIAEDEYGLTLELALPPFEVETFQTMASSCHRVHIPTWGKTLEPGYPELPATSVLIQVPQNGKITAQVLDKQEAVLPNVALCPVPKPRKSDDGTITLQWFKNATAYQQKDFWPDSLLEMESRSILRGISVSRLRIFPFQWNPVTQELRYFNQIRFQVQFEQPIFSNPTLRKGRIEVESAYEKWLQQTIINYQGKHSSHISQPKNDTQMNSAQDGRVRNVSKWRQVPTRNVKSSDVLQIEITEDGIYKLSYQDLANAGLQPQWMNPAHLRMFHQGQEVAIQVVSQDNSQFQPDDYIQFYAQAINNAFTNTNVYWLYWRTKGFGKRMIQIDGSVTGKSETISAFSEHLHFEQNGASWLETPGAPEQDYRFWQRLNASEVGEYTIHLPSPSSQPTEAIVRVHFQGRSTAPPHPNHHTIIKLNGTQIGDEFWDGELPYTQEMRVSSELFVEGNNQLTVEMPGDTGAVVDVIYLNWIEVEYWRNFQATQNRLAFSVTGNGKTQVTINQLSQPEIQLYDITDPYNVAEMSPITISGENPDYQATFATSTMDGEEKHYWLSSTSQIKSPYRLTPVQPAKLKSPKNGADYILITAKIFLGAVEPLGELRRQQGLRVKIVSVEDIYNEFNEGVFDPAAIKNFLRYAYHNWNRPAPTYVFLVGDASMDYKNKTTKKVNRVPAHLSASWEGLTPDDNWYVTVDGDDILPDMLIGRIPSRSPATAATLIDKIIQFEQSTLANPHKVLLVADSGSDFEDLNEGIFSYLPANFQADKIYLSSYLADVEKEEKDAKIAQATQDIITSFNNGVMISNYIGHGVMDRWSQAKGIFTPDDVHTLSNQEQLAFALMLTCINGYFVDATKYSLAEEFLLARGGAIAAFAPSNVSYTWEDMILANEIFSSIFEQNNRNLGTITTSAKIAAYQQGTSQNLLQMFTLFGDPAVNLKNWQN